MMRDRLTALAILGGTYAAVATILLVGPLAAAIAAVGVLAAIYYAPTD